MHDVREGQTLNHFMLTFLLDVDVLSVSNSNPIVPKITGTINGMGRVNSSMLCGIDL